MKIKNVHKAYHPILITKANNSSVRKSSSNKRGGENKL